MHCGQALQCGCVVLIRVLSRKGQAWVIGKGASGQQLAVLAVRFGGPGAPRGCVFSEALPPAWSPTGLQESRIL